MTPIFLVIDSIELCSKSQLGFVKQEKKKKGLKKGIGYLSIHYVLHSEFITGLFIR